MTPLLHLIVAIVTILVYMACKNRFLGLAPKQTSKPIAKEQQHDIDDAVFKPSQRSPKSSRLAPKGRLSACSSCQFRASIYPEEPTLIGQLAAKVFPKHKTDPRIFVDNEEIGQAPMI